MSAPLYTWLVVEVRPADRLAVPTYGPGGQSRAQAHAEVAGFLAALPADAEPVRALWAAGAKDDIVFYSRADGAAMWFAIVAYESGGQLQAVQGWLAEMVELLQGQGVDAQTGRRP